MIERSDEIAQLKQRLHSLSHQRFAGEIDNGRLIDTVSKVLQQHCVKPDTSATPQRPSATAEDRPEDWDDLGPVAKAVLVAIMLVAIGLIVVGVAQS
ncbi:MAG: hypothetical protein ABF296_04090 [Oceanococcaceae bacterium]